MKQSGILSPSDYATEDGRQDVPSERSDEADKLVELITPRPAD